jgi:mRNA-degrading endonuclease RelE of RelBE toxin-antitoxin system
MLKREMTRIRQALLPLEEDPFTPRAGTDTKRLEGTERLYRIRMGPWRAIYGIDGNDVIISEPFRKTRGYDV